MAELIKEEYPLAVIKTSMTRELSSAEVRLEVEVDRESLGVVSVDAGSLGLPLTMEDARRILYQDPTMTLPPDAIAELGQLVREGLAARARAGPQPLAGQHALWIQADWPNGTVPMAPWERLLQPLGAPVLRMPYFAVRPVSSTDALDIVVLATSPGPEKRFDVVRVTDETLDVLIREVGGDLQIHVFADTEAFPQLAPRWGARDTRVHVYDPAEFVTAEDRREKERSESQNADDSAEHPWLAWIIAALGGQSADILHVISHASICGSQGALVISNSPEHRPGTYQADQLSPRAVQRIENRLGAWCTVFTAAPNDYSILGHRLLLDGLARLRPGPVLLDDRGRGFDASGMTAAYRFVCGRSTEPPRSADQIVCVHPARAVNPEIQQSSVLGEFREIPVEWSAARGKAEGLFRSGRGTPSWLASYQRGQELNAARVQRNRRPTGNSELQAASDAGVEDALRILSEVLGDETPGPGEKR